METSVELYVKSKDRWLIDATFPGHQETIAVEDAKQLASQRHVQAVKVIRETLDPATGAKQEKTVFTTEPDKSAENYEESSSENEDEYKNEESPKSWMDEVPDEKPQAESLGKRKKRVLKENNIEVTESSKISLVIKMLSILIFSCGFAAIITLIFQKFGLSLYGQFGI
ncbi:MAG: hypothetical protein CMM49_08245 [Rhodospirillaceae bacterium]|nr:hypothetical protein [Rhodospirillaceae bacterium]|tara:strand:- start:1764 stop:2270 length:507 start_codon:yes stop_codon:yes gene_type:complete